MKQMNPIDDACQLTSALAEKVDHVRRDTSDTLKSAASAIRSTADQSTDAIENAAKGAARGLESTAKFVRTYHPVTDLRGMLSRNPGITLCVGLALGLFAGVSVRRS